MKIRKHAGFSLLEIAVVLAIITVISFAAIRSTQAVLRQTNVVSNLVAIKGSINKARAFALQNSVPVLFNCQNSRIYAVTDFDRDGIFGEENRDLVIGEALGTPVELTFSGVEMVSDSDSRLGTLDHWTGLVNGISGFPNDSFIVTPTGQVFSQAGAPTQGAFFVANKEEFCGAVFVTMLGELKMAIKEKDKNWTWSD
ncbi:MAG: type II secretion system protein [Acidobacteria bacterium]|nr:type II secretion system protein [Acidobacteriota bacterium]MCB9398304.1 type II secretion system protein [Acidobacteriota bacterium]